MKRITFRSPFKVKMGVEVFNQLGHQIGTVVLCHAKTDKDEAGLSYWDVEADVEDDVAAEICQLMEPTLPVT